MSYDFSPPVEVHTQVKLISKVQAVVLFRNATEESITYSKSVIERNLEDKVEYTPAELGKLIHGYYEQLREMAR